MNKLYLSEKDVRAALKGMAGTDNTFWIEPGPGSTFGFPDALIAVSGRLIPVELKAGSVTNGTWAVDLRPTQRAVLLRLALKRVPTVVLIGDKGSWDLFGASGEAVMTEGGRVRDKGERVRVRAIESMDDLLKLVM